MHVINLKPGEWKKILEDHKNGLSPLMLSRKYGYPYEALRSRIRKSPFYIPRSNRFYENPGIKEDIFETIDSDEKAYWLGFIASDGNVCITKNWQYIVQIYLDIKDEAHVKKFYDFIGNQKPIRHRTRVGTNYTKKTVTQAIAAVSSKRMVNSLIKLGITPRKSLTLHWPKLDDPSLYWSFIRGYWDGDGTVGKTYLGVLGTKKFLESMDLFIQSECGFEETGHIRQKWSNTYELRYFTKKAKVVARFIYVNSNISAVLERKLLRAQSLIKYAEK